MCRIGSKLSIEAPDIVLVSLMLTLYNFRFVGRPSKSCQHTLKKHKVKQKS